MYVIFAAMTVFGRLVGRRNFPWSQWIGEKSKGDPGKIASPWIAAPSGQASAIPGGWKISRFLLIAAVPIAAYSLGRAGFEREDEDYSRRTYGNFVAELPPGTLSPGTVPGKAFGSRTAPASGADALVRNDWPKEPPNLDLLKQKVREYHDNAQWEAAISEVCWDAQQYIRQLRRPAVGEKRAIVFDVDETTLSNWPQKDSADFAYIHKDFDDWVMRAEAPAIAPTLDLYRAAVAEGIDVFFICGRREIFRKATEDNLKRVGYSKWKELILRPRTDHEPSIIPFKMGARKRVATSGYRIVANVGDQYSDLEGGYAEKCFKLPNPVYYVK
jgi:acid phosphatase